MIQNQQSWIFKSKEPKGAIYKDEEKRLKLLHGTRQNHKYKIKLNDQILDPVEQANKTSPKGKLALGTTGPDSQVMKVKKQLMNEIKEKDDIFGTQRKLKLGPG